LVDRDTNDPIVKSIFDAMKAKGAGPLNIHRTIANAPEVYKGFSAFASALRQDGESPRAERELAILRTTQLKGGDYEFVQHRRIGLSCGLTESQIDGLPEWTSKAIYNDRQRLILEYVDSMVANGTVDDPTMMKVKQVFSPKEIVELTMTSAFYTAIVQFSRAVRIEPEKQATSYAGC
jgi:alkylhydroperoxidase family enzyme